jgi:OOP family OmpA-OmpF porin
MASKKYMLILGILCLFQFASFAQRNDVTVYWGDSSKVTVADKPQYNEFMNNQYPYPVKPRSMWELGLSVGPSFILGDVSPRFGYAGGISIRKAFSHTLSWRLGYSGSITKGLDWRPRFGNAIGSYQYYGVNPYVPNFRNRTHELYLDLVASLNTLSHYRGNPKTNWYVLGGYSLLSSDVDVNATDANGNVYTFFQSPGFFNRSRGDIRDALKAGMDDTYESNGTVKNGNRDAIGLLDDNQLLRHALNLGTGVALNSQIDSILDWSSVSFCLSMMMKMHTMRVVAMMYSARQLFV